MAVPVLPPPPAALLLLLLPPALPPAGAAEGLGEVAGAAVADAVPVTGERCCFGAVCRRRWIMRNADDLPEPGGPQTSTARPARSRQRAANSMAAAPGVGTIKDDRPVAVIGRDSMPPLPLPALVVADSDMSEGAPIAAANSTHFDSHGTNTQSKSAWDGIGSAMSVSRSGVGVSAAFQAQPASESGRRSK
jgi:hypothetical protein